MRYFKPISIRTLLLTALGGILSFFPAVSAIAQQPTPAGDLTVTVEEQESGDVKFSLSGTAYMQGFHPNMSKTNRVDTPASPPANFSIGNTYLLLDGLTLTMPENSGKNLEIESPEEGAVQAFIDHPLDAVLFDSGGWSLGNFNSGSLFEGDTITGAGSVTTSGIPFFFFVPGTFLVEPGGSINSEPEASVAEGGSSDSGIFPYFITYEVVPFVPNPSLVLSDPGAFPKTIRRKSGGTKKVMIRNNGNAPLTGLSLSISGPGSRDFSSSAIPKTELAPGESTSVEVSFRPKREGKRTATLTVKGFYTPTQQPEPVSAEEEAPEEINGEFPLVPVEVSASTQLTGQGLPRPKPTRRPNTPRFPFGPR